MEPTVTSAAAPASAAAPTAAVTPAATSPVTTTPTAPNPATEALTPDQTTAAMVAAAEAKFAEKPVTAVEPDGTVTKPVEPVVAAKTDAEAKPAETEADDDGYSLEVDGFVGAKDLAAKLDANEALKAALPADIRNEIMANARLAEKAAGYEKFFASPQEAEVVSKTAQEYVASSEAFSLIGRDVPKGTTAFIQKLIEGSAILDDNGNVVKDEQGNIRTDGTAGKFLQEVFSRGLEMKIIKKVEALGDSNVQAALDLVMESVGLRSSTAAEDQDQDPALTQRKADLDAQEARLRDDRDKQTTEARTQYDTLLNSEVKSTYETELSSMLSRATGLSNLERTALEQKIDSAVLAARKANTAYNERKRILQQQPMSVGRRQREVALVKQFLRDNLARIASPFLKEAGVAIGKKVEARAEAQAARAENARSEVSGGAASGTGKPAGTQDPSQQRATVAAELKAKTGSDPSDSDVTIEMMVRAARAKGVAA